MSGVQIPSSLMFLSKLKPLKNFQKGKKNHAGRNNTGRITVRHRGGGHKRVTKKINLNLINGKALVINLEYCSNRNAFLMRVFNNNKFYYMIAPKNIELFDNFSLNNENINFDNGSLNLLKSLPIGVLINNLECRPKSGGIFIKSAGTFGKILYQDLKYTAILLPSGESRLLLNTCTANIGVISNDNFFNFKRYKAGESRWLNKRPSVRGVAMNPIDHPHGGGQGKTSGGRPSVSPWAKLTKGKKTRLTKNKFVLKSL